MFPFFNDERVFIVHQGTLRARRFERVDVAVTADALVVLEGQSSSERSLSPIEIFQASSQPAVERKADVYFDDVEWRERPALALVRNYLDKVEAVVATAENLFQR